MDSVVPLIDVDMDSFAEDNEHCYAPPARIAARFYRKPSTRRKSSAHSSRRSSLSSLHSRHSTLSCHGGPQSTHIAQHLRRASIIESRKARLADRAAHAEQVRLRAAIAKATPRAPYREERAQAAQAAREKLLAEITARCEEEVKRAKKVAEETKEKKAAEMLRLKEEMAEKLADAARRKVIYQAASRRPRTASLAAVEERKISPHVLTRITEGAAAKVIQRSWRSRQRQRTLSAFLELNLNLPRVQHMSFEDMTALLAQENVLSTTNRLLRDFHILDYNGDETGRKGAVRIFLSAFMILSHPVQAFSHGGKEPQEQDLMGKAEKMLKELDVCLQNNNLRSAMKVSAKLPSYDSLAYLFDEYNSAFHAWKSQDQTVLVDVMVNSFVNLDLILQATKDDTDGHVAEDYFHAVRQEQIKLLARLKKLAGPDEALSRVRIAVKKARKLRASKIRRPSEGHVPRGETGSSPKPELAGPVDSSQLAGVAHDIPDTISGASSYVSRLGQTMTVLPSNRQIAHEIQMNGTYEVQQQAWTESRKHVVDCLRTSMRQSMSTGSTAAAASWTHAMAILIREKLLNLVSQRHPLYERLDGFLDPQIIEQTARNGMFSYSEFFETAGQLIARLCSPGRDEAVKAFMSNTTSDNIDRLLALLDVIDLMTLDHINFQFRLAAASVVEHGHELEASCFEKDLRDGVHTLDLTRSWWNNARGILMQTGTPVPNGTAIYARAVVDLVLSNTHMSCSSLPETLRLDWTRLLGLRARALHVVATASILLTTKIRLRRNRESSWTADSERLMALDLTTTDTSRIVTLIETSHMMPDSTRDGLLNFVGRVLPPAATAARNVASAEQAKLNAIQFQQSSSPTATQLEEDVFTEQVATFILKSLREHVFGRLAAVSTADKVRTTTSAPELLARAGMPEFVGEVTSLVDTLLKVRTVDLRSHARWYDEIVA